jgi:hypothetical protein
MAEKEYLVQYKALTDVSRFRTDYDLQGEDSCGFHVFGVDACPICEHSTSDVFPLKVVSGTSDRRLSNLLRGPGKLIRDVTVGSRKTFTDDAGYTAAVPAVPPPARGAPHLPTYYGLLSCKCSVNHAPAANAPEGTKPTGANGCGAFWMLGATPDLNAAGGMDLSVVPKDVDYRTWAASKAAALGVSDSLTTVQTTAAKWQTAMTALLGLLVITGFVARDTISGLTWWGKLIVGVFAAAALVSNFWSIYRYTLASSGRSEVVASGSLADLEQADIEPIRQARRAVARLDSALYFTFISLAAALATLLCVWFLPDADKPKDVSITIAHADGSTSTTCGTLTINRTAKTVTVKPKSKEQPTDSYPISSLAGVGSSC